MSVTLTSFAGRASAEPWAITPRLGVSADYSGNPELLSINGAAEEHVAALIDLPVTFDADAIDIRIHPSGRVGNSRGYASLASNFAHLDSSAQFSNDLGSTTLHGELARDSSLYFAGGLINGIGVRRDSASTGVDWIRAMTERSQVQFDASWTQVHFDQPPNTVNLVNYRYVSAGPTFAFSLSERNTLQLLGSVGLYRSLNGVDQVLTQSIQSKSSSDSLQLGLIRQLDELWKLTTSVGYSRSQNQENVYFGPFFFQQLKATQGSTVYAASLVRQGETLSFNAGASRAFQPTGLAFLSKQDSIDLGLTYVRSERWDYALGASWQRAINPIIDGGSVNVRYLNAQFTANWHWTPQWLVSMHAARVSQEHGPPMVTAGSNELSIDFVRQFLRSDL